MVEIFVVLILYKFGGSVTTYAFFGGDGSEKQSWCYSQFMMNMRSTRLLGKATPAFGLHLVHKVLQNPIRNWQLKTPFQISLRICAKKSPCISSGKISVRAFGKLLISRALHHYANQFSGYLLNNTKADMGIVL